MAIPDNDPSAAPPAAPARPSWEAARPAPAPSPTYAQAPTYEPPGTYEPPAAAAYQAPAYQPPTDLEGDVKYDLAGNPIPGSGPTASAMASPMPSGYPAGQAAGTWPPPVGGPGYGAQAYRNNSGEQSHLPPELERLRWHWGAFFLPTFWSRRHGLRALAFIIVIAFFLLRVLRSTFSASSAVVFVALYVLYAVAHLGVQVYFGMNGHKIAWRNRHFPGGVDEYFKVQNRWMWWGFGISAFGIVLLAAALIQILLIGHHPAPYAYGHGASTYNGGSNYGSGGSRNSGQ